MEKTGRAAVVVVVLVLCTVGGVGEARGGGNPLENIVHLTEELYLKSLSVITGQPEFAGLSAEDVSWLLQRLEGDADHAKRAGESVMSDQAVRDFLCVRRGMSEHCSPEQQQRLLASRQKEEEPKRHLRIATKHCEPFVYCEKGTTYTDIDPEKPRGYSIDFLDEIIRRTNVSSYEISCLSSVPAIIDDMARDKYDVGIACISVLSDRLPLVSFSRVYYYSGLQIMIMTPETLGKSALSMLDPFTVGVWVCVLATIVVVGVFVWVFERNTNSNMKRRPVAGLALGQWHAWTTFLQSPFINYKSWAAKLTIWSFLLVSLVIVATYTANLAAFLTRNQLTSNIQGFKDLQGKVVGTSAVNTSAEVFMSAQHDIVVKPFVDNEQLLVSLEDKEIDAVVWDSPQLWYHAHQDCDKMIVGEVFNTEDYAIALRKDDEELWNMFDGPIIQLKEERLPERLYEMWFEDLGNCVVQTNFDENVSETDPVSLETTWVLFVFQAGTLIIAMFLHWMPRCWKMCGVVDPELGEDDFESDVSSDPGLARQYGRAGMFKSNAELNGGVPVNESSTSIHDLDGK